MDRDRIKRIAPPIVKTAFAGLRKRLNGPGIEYSVMHDYAFQSDDSFAPRINLLMPDLPSSGVFGGVATGLNLFDQLVRLLAPAGVEARLVTEQAVDPRESVLGAYAALASCDLHALEPQDYVLPTRARDMFIVFNWWTSLNLEAVLAAQARHFSARPFPKLHLIQDYEPNFYPFSAAHLLACEAMGGRWPLWAIFNTHELRAFWQAQGHDARKVYVFEPRMNARLRPFADKLTVQEKTRTVLVYGRPQISRNAFFLVQRGLEHWARTFGPAHRDWRILSVGMAHDAIELGGGHRLVSLGKMGLDEYGRLLRKASIGLSLMASPHPSYPPLEMAHFGVRVLTNAYRNKCPASRHQNLVTLDGIRPGDIAEALEGEIAAFQADPAIGVSGKSHMPDYLEEDRIECCEAIAADIRDAMKLVTETLP